MTGLGLLISVSTIARMVFTFETARSTMSPGPTLPACRYIAGTIPGVLSRNAGESGTEVPIDIPGLGWVANLSLCRYAAIYLA